MALYSIDGRGRTQRVTYTPHEAEFNLWRSRLTTEQIDAIRLELRSLIDGDEVHTAGWMPGNDWTGTVWEPIYTDACQKNIELSGLLFRIVCVGGDSRTSRGVVVRAVRKGRYRDTESHLLSHFQSLNLSTNAGA